MCTEAGAIITLSPSEILLAGSVALQIHAQNMEHNARARYGAPTNLAKALTLGVTGALGELAVAKYTQQYWNGNVGNRKAKDVNGIQVRTTPLPAGDLCLHDPDPPSDPYVCVQIVGNDFHLRGWAWGWQVKIEDYWSDKYNKNRPAYWMPPTDLNPMTTLPLA